MAWVISFIRTLHLAVSAKTCTGHTMGTTGTMHMADTISAGGASGFGVRKDITLKRLAHNPHT